jgi:sugar lactone lactonase YvrE
MCQSLSFRFASCRPAGVWFSILFLLATIPLSAQIITTVAGSDQEGDGGPATATSLYNPYGMAVDASGNLYIADGNKQRIRKVSPGGIISTVAGNGSLGFGGDGGAAASASLNNPRGVAVDASGNLYIADFLNQRIRKVNTSGIISTVAGNGSRGFGGDGGAATSASLSDPIGIAVDASGNLYITDVGNQRIRKVNTSGIISTVVGNGSAGFSGDGGVATVASLNNPYGVAVDASGNLYIADRSNQRIRKVNTSGIISTVAGTGSSSFSGDGGAATSAGLYSPGDVAVDASGNLYIADYQNQRIRKVNTGGIISTVAGIGFPGFSGDGGAATVAALSYPNNVAVCASGDLYIADTENRRVRKVNTSGIISTVAGNGSPGFSGDGGLATSAGLNYPGDVAVDASGNLYIADIGNQRIRKVSPGGIISTVAGNGSRGFSGDGGVATSASLNNPIGIAVDASGNIYIVDNGNYRIRKVSTSGIISTVAGTGSGGFSGDGGPATAATLYNPYGVAVDGSGNLYIADYQNQRIRKVNTSGIISTVAGNGSFGFSGDGGAATAASLNAPYGVAVDASGNLYIADYGNHRIRKVNTSGIISTVAGTGSQGFSGDGGAATSAKLNYPSDVAVDGSGNLYIADASNQRIRRVFISGNITTVAGNGSFGFGGDGGAATSASLDSPRGVVLDGSGNLYIADYGNHRIRKVSGLTNGSLAITGVSGLSCTPVNTNGYTISFSPQYSGTTGAPISFSVVNELLPTTNPGPYSLQLYIDNPNITLKAFQTGTDGEASFVYNWLSACNTTPMPPAAFAITGVNGVSCTPLSATSRRLSFSPTYTGTTGAPISFSVVNEMLPTTSPGPYTLTLYIDNPSITLRAVQTGSSASFAYNWLSACSASARTGATEIGESLRVLVLSNPTVADQVSVEIGGAVGGLMLSVFDSRGHRVSEKSLAQSAGPVRTTVGLGQSGGVYLLRVLTATQSQVVKVIRE